MVSPQTPSALVILAAWEAWARSSAFQSLSFPCTKMGPKDPAPEGLGHLRCYSA